MTSTRYPTGLILATLGAAATMATPAVARQTLHDGRFTGRTYSAYYGYVQVRADISGGKLRHVDILRYPSDRRTSRFIASRSLPQLEREAVYSQSAQVDLVSGATLTSRAFVRSLQSALDKAK